VENISALDISHGMLEVAKKKLMELSAAKWNLTIADHG